MRAFLEAVQIILGTFFLILLLGGFVIFQGLFWLDGFRNMTNATRELRHHKPLTASAAFTASMVFLLLAYLTSWFLLGRLPQ